METVQSSSPNETIKIAKEFAKTVKPGDVICLEENLGAGKTHFVRGFVQGLGLSGDIVSSPPLPSSMNTRANFPFIILIVTDLNMCERLSKLERKNICMVMAFALSSGRVGLQIYCHQAQSMLPLASLERITAKLVFNRNLKWQHETGDSLTDWICSP